MTNRSLIAPAAGDPSPSSRLRMTRARSGGDPSPYARLRMTAVLLAALLAAAAGNATTFRLGGDVVPVSQQVRLRVDPRQDSFRGSVRIDLDVKRPVTHFHFHSADGTIESVRLNQNTLTHAADIEQTVRVTAGSPIPPGRHTLLVEFSAPFNRSAVGLYKMVKDGEPYLFTQFEAIDARRAFPCWDEPSFKLPYELTLEVPTQYTAVANTPVTEESESDPWKTVRFAATKPLPSYLVAFAVGKFDFVPIEGLGVPARVVAPKGQGGMASLAVRMTQKLLPPQERYFESKYPFEKLDLIAVPEYWAGAMENPGLITFRDSILLVDTARATPTQKRNLARIIAHELAHMWFGDLVTMEWWNDFWLNESFADWMGDKITEQIYPELGLKMAELQIIQATMNGDARASTVPMRNPNATPEEAMRTVGLAYNKGKAVLGMFEQWIGEEKFRRGVLDHLEANAWGNADAFDFFRALARNAPKGAAEALETFVDQPGLPLVKAEWTNGTLRLSQTRFMGGDAPAWKIPVTIRYDDGKKTQTAIVLLETRSKTVTLSGKPQWLHPDAGAAGYYRWQIPPEAMRTLAERSADVLSPGERVAFLGNAGALLRAGSMQGGEYFDVLSRFGGDPHPQVVQAAIAAAAEAKLPFVTAENQAAYAAYVRRTFRPALDRVGMSRKAEEEDVVPTLRSALISLLGEDGEDADVIAWAKANAAKYLADPSSVDQTLATAALAIAARDGDAALFDEYVKRFENPASPSDRARFLSVIGKFRRPELRARAFDYVLQGSVRPPELFTIPAAGNETEADRDVAYRWTTANYETLSKRLPPAFLAFMPQVAAGCEPARLKAAREFFATRKVEGMDRSFSRVTEQVNECVALRERELAHVNEYFNR